MSFLPHNLKALAEIDSALAVTIQSVPVPHDFTPALGTDGTPTYRRTLLATDGSKRVEWLGNTSMPRASAAAIVGSLDAFSHGANGLGLTVGTGYEWAAFAQKLGRSQMVFVYETTAALRMALEICDLAELLSARKIVLLSGSPDDAAGSLVRFLDQNSGFDAPTVLHPLPSIAGARRNELLTAGEIIVRRGMTGRQSCMAPLPERIARALQHQPQNSTARRWLAFLLTPRYPAERSICRAARDRRARCVFIDRHDSASPALRLQILAEDLERPMTVQEQTGRVEVLSDLYRAQLATVPPEVPVETWVPPLAGPGYWERVPPAETLALHDRIIVHSGFHIERLLSRGIPREKIELRPLAPLSPAPSARASEPAVRQRVAMIADLPPSDAASLGIELPTHQAVFAAAVDLITADYLAVHPGMAPDLLRRALGGAGVDPQTQDTALRDSMLRIVRDVLIPALPPLILAEALASHGIPLTLIGDWPGLERRLKGKVADNLARIVRFEDYAAGTWDQAAVLVHLSPSGTVSPLLWDAVAGGITVAAPDHPSDRQPGSLAKLFAPESQYARSAPGQFIASIKSLLRDHVRREKLSLAAANSPGFRA